MVDTIFPTPNTYTARQGRQTQAAAFAGATGARPFGAITGLRPGTSVTTVTATTTTVTCQPFGGIADPQTSNLAGAYEFACDGVFTVALVAQSASVPRSDIVWVQMNDNQEDGSGATNSSSAVRGYTAGTTVTIPAAPARSFIIAVINVPIAGSSPTVTWVAPYTVAAGGVLPIPSVTALPTSPALSQLFDDATQGATIKWNGTKYVPAGMKFDLATAGPTSPTVPFIKAGVASVTFTSGAGLLTFPTAFPTACLVLLVNAQAAQGLPLNLLSNPGTALSPSANQIANTGSFSGNFGVHYIAVGW